MKTLTEQLKEFGAKITKVKKGEYTYNGVNFKINIFKDGCDTTYWTVEHWKDENVSFYFEYYGGVMYETKKEVIEELFNLDKNFKVEMNKLEERQAKQWS